MTRPTNKDNKDWRFRLEVSGDRGSLLDYAVTVMRGSQSVVVKDRGDTLFTLEFAKDKIVAASNQENIDKTWKQEATARFDTLDSIYTEGLKRLFELYSPFAELIGSDLPDWFIPELRDDEISRNYMLLRQKIDPASVPKASTVMVTETLDRVKCVKQTLAFKAMYYCAWVILLLSFVPLKYSDRADSFSPTPVGMASSFCEVGPNHQTAVGLVIVTSAADNVPIFSQLLIWHIAGLLVVGSLSHAVVIVLWPSTFNIVLITASSIAKVCFLFYGWRLRKEAIGGCVGDVEQHALAFEKELYQAMNGQDYSPFGSSEPMKDAGEIPLNVV